MSVYLHLVKRGLGTKCFRAALFAFLGSYHEYERHFEKGMKRSCGLTQMLLRLHAEEEAATSPLAS